VQFGLVSIFVFTATLCAGLGLIASGAFGPSLAAGICYLGFVLGYGCALGAIKPTTRLSVAVVVARGVAFLTFAGALGRCILARLADAGAHEVRRWTIGYAAVVLFVLFSQLLIEWTQAPRKHGRQMSFGMMVGWGLALALQVALVYRTVQKVFGNDDLGVNGGIFSFDAEWLLSLAFVNVAALLAGWGKRAPQETKGNAAH
jgi:hypothetical protein